MGQWCGFHGVRDREGRWESRACAQCRNDSCGDCVSAPDLVADFLLVLFPVADAAAAEEDDGDDDEEEEDNDDGHCDDAWSVGGWKGVVGVSGLGLRQCGHPRGLGVGCTQQVHSEYGHFSSSVCK